MKLLFYKNVTQYFVDSSYKCLQNNIPECKAFLLTLSHEDRDILCELYLYLKNIWNLIPKKITYDFALDNINAINIVNKNDEICILPYFFHLIQCWWRKKSKLGFRKKE